VNISVWPERKSYRGGENVKRYDAFFGYTFPETELFGEETERAVNIMWDEWQKIGFRKMQRFLSLAFRYSPARLESACKRALFYGKPTMENVQKILELKLDSLKLQSEADMQGQFLFKY